ncbi:hypothetical protein Ciccas_006748, partial [Cichlidogyrus casuarinus]
VILTSAQMIELLMTCILYIILSGEMLIGCFPNGPINLTGYITLSSAILAPCALLRSVRTVSWLSFYNTITHIVINIMVIVYCFTMWSKWNTKVVNFQPSFSTFPIAMGIIVFSYTSQIFLPTLEKSMVDRDKFKCMLFWTHSAAAICKVAFGYIGAVTYGSDTDQVITNNIEAQNLKLVLNFALFVKAMLSFPLPYFAAVELMENELGKYLLPAKGDSSQQQNWTAVDVATVDQVGYYQENDAEGIAPVEIAPSESEEGCFTKWFMLKSKKIKTRPRVNLDGNLKPLPWQALSFRFLLVFVTFVLAVTVPHFAILMALIGSFTGTMLSLVWPAYFHLKIKAEKLNMRRKIQDYLVILMGLFSCVSGVYFSTLELNRVMHGVPQNRTGIPILIVNETNSCFGAPCDQLMVNMKT